MLKSLVHTDHLEDFLLLLEFQRQVRNDGVSQAAAFVYP